MRKTIVRTIESTTVKSANVSFVKGAPVAKENPVLTFNGKLTEDKAIKEVQKVYGATAQVVEITSVNDSYEIGVEDFMKYAKKVGADSTSQETTEQGEVNGN